MTTPKQPPLSFALTESEIGQACRAAIVNRLQKEELHTAPFAVELKMDRAADKPVYLATVTFWPKREYKPRKGKE